MPQYNWREMTWDELENFQSEFPLSQEEEAERQAELTYRQDCDDFGQAWKDHARNGGDRPTTTPPNF